jgi:hypothetical protein
MKKLFIISGLAIASLLPLAASAHSAGGYSKQHVSHHFSRDRRFDKRHFDRRDFGHSRFDRRDFDHRSYGRNDYDRHDHDRNDHDWRR